MMTNDSSPSLEQAQADAEAARIRLLAWWATTSPLLKLVFAAAAPLVRQAVKDGLTLLMAATEAAAVVTRLQAAQSARPPGDRGGA